MDFKTLFGKNFAFQDKQDWQIEGVCHESEKVKPGDAYFCLTKDFEKAKIETAKAFSNGAQLLVSEFDLPFQNSIQVKDVRDVFAQVCKNFYGKCCDEMKIVGITGTNGKTTTSHLIAEMLNRSGRKAGVIGTNGVFFCGKHFDCPLTTPDADFLHKTFKEMKDAGVEYVVMEVSAHAIDQKRTNGIKFEIGVLTNITQDHLDYFKTFERYAMTKLSFFDKKHMKKAIICADDELARRFAEGANLPVVTFGQESPSDVFAMDAFCSIDGTRFVANLCDENILDIKTNLVGKYNINNCLAALAVCKELGLCEEELQTGLNFVMPVEGRFNVMRLDGKYVIIDFAHSPDGLEKVLSTAKTLTDKNVWVVFGCGGNRDRDKRHKMGRIAEKYADFVCLTDDNPRLERSQDIIADIEKGMKRPHLVEPDRKKAIKSVVEKANEDDIIIIAGKGAEKYQEIGTQKIPYNDFDVIYELFKESDPTKFRGMEI